MTQPSEFTRLADYTDDEANNVSGRTTVRAAALDAELDAIQRTVSELRANLALIQRDDTRLADGVVDIGSLSPQTLSLIATSGTRFRGPWAAATAYAIGDVVSYAPTLSTYVCNTAHTSSATFSSANWTTLYQQFVPEPDAPITFPVQTVFGRSGNVTPQAGDYQSSQVNNASAVTGTTVSDALNTLSTQVALASNKLNLSGGTLTGALNLAQAAPIEAAWTTALGGIAGNVVEVTGGTAASPTVITDLGSAPAGAERLARFSGYASVSHSGAIFCPMSKPLAVKPGDMVRFVSLGAGQWAVSGYLSANGMPLTQLYGCWRTQTAAQTINRSSSFTNGVGTVETTVQYNSDIWSSGEMSGGWDETLHAFAPRVPGVYLVRAGVSFFGPEKTFGYSCVRLIQTGGLVGPDELARQAGTEGLSIYGNTSTTATVSVQIARPLEAWCVVVMRGVAAHYLQVRVSQVSHTLNANGTPALSASRATVPSQTFFSAVLLQPL